MVQELYRIEMLNVNIQKREQIALTNMILNIQKREQIALTNMILRNVLHCVRACFTLRTI